MYLLPEDGRWGSYSTSWALVPTDSHLPTKYLQQIDASRHFNSGHYHCFLPILVSLRDGTAADYDCVILELSDRQASPAASLNPVYPAVSLPLLTRLHYEEWFGLTGGSVKGYQSPTYKPIQERNAYVAVQRKENMPPWSPFRNVRFLLSTTVLRRGKFSPPQHGSFRHWFDQ